jgi:ABC-type transport system involved in cytochrome c biogenesis permease subunit
VDAVGAFVAPQALLFLLASRFVGPVDAEPRLRSALLPFHVDQQPSGNRSLHARVRGGRRVLCSRSVASNTSGSTRSSALPAVDALDRAEHRFLAAGFPLLTIGALTGTFWAREVEAGGAADIARAVLSYVSWALIGVVLLLRASAGWRGRRAAVGTILCFGLTVLVLVAYLVRSFGAGGHA